MSEELPLAVRDKRLIQIQDEILRKRMFITKKNRELQKKNDVNVFLDSVRANYAKYHGAIVAEKQKQLGALKTLETYLDDLRKTNADVGLHLREADSDYKHTMREIKNVSAEIDALIEGDGDEKSK